jgi:diadenosine tetraphosphate (Ap4A) HIT family hydrolase
MEYGKMKTIKELPQHLTEAAREGLAPWTDSVRMDFHVAVFEDKFPVARGHLLFVPQYSEPNLINNCFDDALTEGLKRVSSGEWEAFNIGLNWGTAAGQTVPWPHVHLIPRKIGDCADPTGGIRNTIPGQGNYHNSSYKLPTKVQ